MIMLIALVVVPSHVLLSSSGQRNFSIESPLVMTLHSGAGCRKGRYLRSMRASFVLSVKEESVLIIESAARDMF